MCLDLGKFTIALRPAAIRSMHTRIRRHEGARGNCLKGSEAPSFATAFEELQFVLHGLQSQIVVTLIDAYIGAICQQNASRMSSELMLTFRLDLGRAIIRAYAQPISWDLQ